ncbi:hypothetical protein BC830DRAFT_1171735 [Chytriomyces sp. MP71]|nr:hypothetical protein BC830DRAFT_1171735 [Chytriomyces sp. MP71]
MPPALPPELALLVLRFCSSADLRSLRQAAIGTVWHAAASRILFSQFAPNNVAHFLALLEERPLYFRHRDTPSCYDHNSNAASHPSLLIASLNLSNLIGHKSSITDVVLSRFTLQRVFHASRAGIGPAYLSLSSLDLTNCHALTDDSVVPFLSHNPRLRTLILEGCTNISRLSLNTVFDLLLLDSLNVALCTRISETALQDFVRRRVTMGSRMVLSQVIVGYRSFKLLLDQDSGPNLNLRTVPAKVMQDSIKGKILVFDCQA